MSPAYRFVPWLRYINECVQRFGRLDKCGSVPPTLVQRTPPLPSPSWRRPAPQTAPSSPPRARPGTPSKSTPRACALSPAAGLLLTAHHPMDSPQYLGRKTLPIKRADAEPLTREDIQYDLLYFIFADPTQAFIDSMAPGQPRVNFCDLYVNALFNSSKCSKVLKDKMVDTPEFAIEFAKIALLTNVGRINTTMACASIFSAHSVVLPAVLTPLTQSFRR